MQTDSKRDKTKTRKKQIKTQAHNAKHKTNEAAN